MTSISLEGLSKHFPVPAGSVVRAVDDVTLKINRGELFFLLGPSGCGKTTLLRVVAGIIRPTSGRVFFDDRDMARVSPEQRNTGMVFQSYALWPHMTVAHNVGFGLRARKVPRDERNDRVRRALEMVHMERYASHKPGQLSGGEQQRVSLARALSIRPNVLLLDEPLSNLDTQLRQKMRTEIRRICKESGITAIYVTHDQKEALAMADRVAVMSKGRIVQVGSPSELYRRPTSRFVAECMGKTNLLRAKVLSKDGDTLHLQTSAGELRSTVFDSSNTHTGAEVMCSIRPEALRLVEGGSTDTQSILHGKLRESTFLGECVQYTITCADGMTLKALEMHSSRIIPVSEREIFMVVEPHDVVVLYGEIPTQ